MLPFLFRRVLQFIPTFILATLILFFIVQAAPGDFLTQLSQNPRVTPERLEQLRTNYLLDQPLWTQYFRWFTTSCAAIWALRCRQSTCLGFGGPRLWNSLILVIISTILTYGVGLFVGIYGALRPYTLGDRVVSVFAYFGLGIPSFFFALLVIFGLVVLKQNTGWDVPITGKSSPVLQNPGFWRNAWDVFIFALAPSIVLALRSISSESRFIRGQMLEVMGQDYIPHSAG